MKAAHPLSALALPLPLLGMQGLTGSVLTFAGSPRCFVSRSVVWGNRIVKISQRLDDSYMISCAAADLGAVIKRGSIIKLGRCWACCTAPDCNRLWQQFSTGCCDLGRFIGS